MYIWKLICNMNVAWECCGKKNHILDTVKGLRFKKVERYGHFTKLFWLE